MQHGDAVRDGHDDAHVMLDENNGDATRLQFSKNTYEFFGFALIKTSRRLVKQQKPRLGPERDR